MERHSFKLELPASTSWGEVKAIALEQVVYPHMHRAGKNSYADLIVNGDTRPTAQGMSTFTGEYLI
ncbi:hypothetical protein [Nocardia sp. NPDC059239]|uniref:hypothetical protein n=1 Tax=unclassified Nocardia TaxID=2637762 RepID=UPI00367BE5F0